MALKFLRSYPITLAAGETRALNVEGDYFNVLASNQTNFELGFDNGPTTEMEQGFSGKVGYNGDPYRTVTVYNPNASSLTLTLALGYGELWDNKATLNGAVDIAPASSFTAAAVTVADSATVIIAQNLERKKVTLRNVGGATVYLGSGDDVTKDDGFPFDPGEVMEFENSAAIYGIVEADTCEVRVCEEA